MAGIRFQAGGSLREGAFYVERDADRRLLEALLKGEYCNVLAPRQVGKTSLAQRTAQRLAEHGRRTAIIDLTSVGSHGVEAPEWFCSVADLIGRELNVDAMASWAAHPSVSPAERLLSFLREQVAAPGSPPLVIFIDEIDVLVQRSFADDFFALLRSIHNSAPRDSVSARLVFCLIGVLVPLDLTSDPRQTPYNIGREIALEDLQRPEMQLLELGLSGLGAAPERLLDEVFRWTNGHPALTQFLCERLVALGASDQEPGARVQALVRKALLEPLPRDTRVLLHIESFFSTLGRQTNRMLALYRRVLLNERVRVEHTNHVHIALRRLGMVVEENTGNELRLRPRNQIFQEVFSLEWVRRHEESHKFSAKVHRWLENGRGEHDLLSEKELVDFERWAKVRADLTTDEVAFQLASKDRLERSYKRRQQIYGLAAGLLAMLLTLTISKALRFVNQSNALVISLKSDLQKLSGPYESMKDYPARRPQVQEEAVRIAEALLRIDDAQLAPTHRIVKHQYAAYAFVMAAAAYSLGGDAGVRDCIRYADMAINASRHGLQLYMNGEKSQDKEERKAYEWAQADNGHNRMRYLLAMALALKGSAEHNEPLRAPALESLGRVERAYRLTANPMKTRELAWICPPDDPPSVCEPGAP